MVLGSAGGRLAGAAFHPRETIESGGSGTESLAADVGADSARALHERLVAFVHAVAGERGRAGDVWVEHSYARARGVPGEARELLAPRAPPDGADVDVERLDPEPPPALEPPPDDDDDCADDEDAGDWEAKVAALAPSATHARLAVAAADILRRLRLARLAGGGREATRQAARRLRLALAPLWVWPGPPQLRPAAWLNAALLAHLPRSLRRLYDDAVAALRRTSPRLTERLLLGRLPAPADDPLGATGPALGPGAPGPVLLWLGAGAADARWTRRLRALLHTRELHAAASGAPDAWCAHTAAALRADLCDALAETGSRGAVVCGFGAGAALAGALLGAGAGALPGRVVGAVLLAPPLLTAEGAWAPRALVAPALLVAGTGAARSWRGAARALQGGRLRVLLVAGADDALRLPHAQRARLRLPQHALDAALAEEVYRWSLEALEAAERPDEAPEVAAAAPPGDGDGDRDDAPPTPRSSRSIEIVEGRVVSRVSGSTPLALLPPRRRRDEPALAGAAPVLASAADILQLPIVFADDERALPAPAPLTVTSGDPRGGRITRVIVASRGRGERRLLRRTD